ncbi:MAG: O-methyltransferase [Ruminococcaceae bacterium]|nr:O-methyltransferase [Oscillospiraceae bacterium]
MDNQITYPYIDAFLNAMQMPQDAFLQELEAFCRAENIPAAMPMTARLLYVLAAIKKPKRIIEVGTAAGYSALTLFAGSGKTARIVTIEKDEERFLLARRHFREYGASDMIKPLCGDAEELLASIEGPFDLAFIDAAKVATKRHFDLIVPKMSPDGILVTDNVLYGGRTAMPGEPAHKHRTGVRAMREYVDYLCHDSRFVTVVLPVGDGVAVTKLAE